MPDWDSLDTFDYPFDEGLIAQEPLPRRSDSRLLCLDRAGGATTEKRFADFPGQLRSGDLLVFNDTRVWNARLHGHRPGGGAAELLVTAVDARGVRGLLRPAKRLREGEWIQFEGARFVLEGKAAGEATGAFFHPDGRPMEIPEVHAFLSRRGQVPLPPYIHHPPEHPERYQTVYSRETGSSAAPTAGLHFTDEILGQLEAAGVEKAFLTLHVGPGTFLPVYSERLEGHVLHEEPYHLPEDTAHRLAKASAEGRRIVAVGTTALRALEDNFRRHGGRFEPGRYATRLFVRPPDRPGAVSALLTNFHLPRSTLFMLVCAFGGYEAVRSAYALAVAKRYRFFSFGDAMFLS